MMIPLQDIDVHTDKQVFYKLHVIAPTGRSPFAAEVLVYDSEFKPAFASTVSFNQTFSDSRSAFSHAFNWINGYSAKHGYTINRINNPCNCEFVSQADQQSVVQAAGLALTVQVNGA